MQTALVLLSFWALAGVGVGVVRRNWDGLLHGSLARGGAAALMADEWHLSNEGRAVIRQAFWLGIGVILVTEGVIFSGLGVYTLLTY